MELTEVPAAEWDGRLDALGVTDAYWRRPYVAASAPLAGGEPVLLHLAGPGGDVVFAGVVRRDPTDVVTPYGYGGPLGVGGAPPLEHWAAAYARWCARRGVVTTFAVQHPLVVAQGEAPGLEGPATAGTVAWDLGAEDLLAGMHKHHRRLVRRARREGLEATVRADPPDLEEFAAVYAATMERNRAAGFYHFGPAYWAALLDGVALVRVDVRDAAGTLLAGVLGMGRPPLLHYHLGGSADAGRGTGASHLALLTLAEHGRAAGHTTLHLGGGVGGRADELLRYKQRFAPEGLVPGRLGKAVHDRDAYGRLGGDPDVLDGFFPAYRAPR